MNIKGKILAVDDQQENRLLVTRILDRPEYEVITAASGLEALQLLERDPDFDVMLLDVMMPDLNGFKVLETVKTNPLTNRIKVIMFSVLSRAEDKVKAFESGAADYIVKPFNRIELLARIELQLKLSRMEKELFAERNLLRLLIDNLPDLIYVKDTHSRFMATNVANVKMMGAASPAELIGQTDFDYYPHQLASQYYADEQTIIRTGQPLQAHEEPVIDPAGRPGWILTTKVPLTDASGNIVGLVGIGRDITKRKQAEDALRKLSRAIDQSANAIVITNLAGVIEFVNPAFSTITGYSFSEAIGQNPRILKSGQHPLEFYEILWSTVLGGDVWHGELVNKRKNGEFYWEMATISPVKGEHGQITHFVAVKEDITKRKQMEAELRQAKEAAEAATKAKSAFLANMSHEIRTPMNGVIGMASLLLDTGLTPQQRDFVEIIRTSGESLLTIINDILDFSKIEAGKLELENQPFILRKCVEEALDLVAPTAAEKHLELAYLLDDQLPEAFEGDVTRLRQVLVNLLSNAVKFTPTGEVVVSVKAERETRRDESENELHIHPSPFILHFSIRDTGIGIPEDRLNYLFRPFSQADASTTRRYGGTGLGLAICKHLSQLMGGDIWVESAAGRGSTFHFTITAKATTSPQLPYPGDTRPYLANKRILIVDDHETNRRILAHQATTWGLLPTVVSSGAQALTLVQQHTPFDLAILDMQMPEMDGLTLAAEIRKYRDEQALPLIMLSSLGRLDYDPETVRFAANLTKPIKPAQLYDILVRVLANQAGLLAQISPPAQLDQQMGQNHPLRILLAEDNVVNQKVALSILARLGYRADLAANGLEVLEALRRQPYDVVLLDVQMPEMDGLAAAHHIRQVWPPDQQPRLIAVTANALQGDREKYLQAGLDDYVSKPIRVTELVQALKRCQPYQAQPDEPASTPPLTGPTKNGSINGSNGSSPKVKAGPPAAAAFDRSALDWFQTEFGADGPDVINQLVTLFFEDSAKVMATLQQGIATQNIEEVRRAAHTLKSNSATLGALKLSELCAELENRSRSGSLAGAGEMAAGIHQALNLAWADLKRYVVTEFQESATTYPS